MLKASRQINAFVKSRNSDNVENIGKRMFGTGRSPVHRYNRKMDYVQKLDFLRRHYRLVEKRFRAKSFFNSLLKHTGTQ